MDESFRDRTAFIRGAKDIAKEVKKHAAKKVSKGMDRVQDEYTKRSYSRFEEEEDDEDYAPQDGYYRGGEGANEEEGASSDATEGHDEEDEIYEGEYQGIPRQDSLKTGERLGAEAAVGAFDDSEGQRRKDKEELAQQYELILQECGHGRFQWTLYFVLGLALMADGVEVFVVGFVLPSAEKDMCLSDSNKGMLGLIVYLGMMVGAFLWGGLADRLGRRQCLLISLSVNSVFAFFSSFVQGYGTFLFCRLLSGVGIGGSIPIVFSYFSEFLAQEKRGEHLSWLCMFWMIGGIYASAMAWAIIPHYGWSFQMGSAYQFHSWRVFVLVCAFPSVFAIGALTTMPESPRFFLENGKHDEAWMVLKQVHDTNMRAKGHPERVFSVTHIKTIKREDELIEIQSDTGTWYRRWLVRFLNLSQQVWSNFQQCFAPEYRRNYNSQKRLRPLPAFRGEPEGHPPPPAVSPLPGDMALRPPTPALKPRSTPAPPPPLETTPLSSPVPALQPVPRPTAKPHGFAPPSHRSDWLRPSGRAEAGRRVTAACPAPHVLI
ncbi:synaptic vesicle glycoprotein 2A [Leptosomus discolor]